ncbi:hypothetical protein [Nocardia sp. NPDC052566]|uniref:hypothetical protein n=1 Tax=Nocardia sp. NPDC052566 TaxID=3364330 RepID=UPI0037C59922
MMIYAAGRTERPMRSENTPEKIPDGAGDGGGETQGTTEPPPTRDWIKFDSAMSDAMPQDLSDE